MWKEKRDAVLLKKLAANGALVPRAPGPRVRRASFHRVIRVGVLARAREQNVKRVVGEADAAVSGTPSEG